MYKNPEKVRKLEAEVQDTYKKYIAKLGELNEEKIKVPTGYKVIACGETVKEGAIAFDPVSKVWYKTCNSVGKVLNIQGYVDGVTHRGYKYANLK